MILSLQFLYIFLKRTLFADEQVALKKKEKEASEKWNNQWKKSDSNEALWEKCQDFDKSRVRVTKSNICRIWGLLITILKMITSVYIKFIFRSCFHRHLKYYFAQL